MPGCLNAVEELAGYTTTSKALTLKAIAIAWPEQPLQ